MQKKSLVISQKAFRNSPTNLNQKITQLCFVFFCIIFCLSLAGCSDTSSDEPVQTVQISIPTSFLGEIDPASFDVDQYAEKQGFLRTQFSEDKRSLILTMTPEKHSEIMEDTASSCASMVNSLLIPDEGVKVLSHMDDYSVITMEVDPAKFNADPSNYIVQTALRAGRMYQAVSGREPNVKVIINDADTGDEILSVSYPEE